MTTTPDPIAAPAGQQGQTASGELSSAVPAASPDAAPRWFPFALGGLFVAATALFLTHYGNQPVASWDEAWYAEVAKQMLLRHDWLDQWVNGQPFTDKPPLLTWLIAASYSLFGVNEWATRVPSALFGAGCLVQLALIAKKLYNWRIAAVSALVLPFMELFLSRASLGDLDAALLCFTLGALYSYLRHGKRVGAEVGVWTGLAVMTKGAGGILPLLIIGAFHLAGRGWPSLGKLKPSLGLLKAGLVTIAVAAPWHLFMTMKRGYEFWDSYLLYHVFKRATSTIEDQASDPLYYVHFLRTDLGALWPVAMLGLAWMAWEGLRRIGPEQPAHEAKRAEAENHRFVLAAFLVPFLAFSAAHTKLFWYVLPAYPALAIAAAHGLRQAWAMLKTWSPGSAKARLGMAGLMLVSLGLTVRNQHKDDLYYWFVPHLGVREAVLGANMNFGPDVVMNIWVPNASVDDPKWYNSHINPHVALVYDPDILFYRQGQAYYLAKREERQAYVTQGSGVLMIGRDDWKALPPAVKKLNKPVFAQSGFYFIRWTPVPGAVLPPPPAPGKVVTDEELFQRSDSP